MPIWLSCTDLYTVLVSVLLRWIRLVQSYAKRGLLYGWVFMRWLNPEKQWSDSFELRQSSNNACKICSLSYSGISTQNSRTELLVTRLTQIMPITRRESSVHVVYRNDKVCHDHLRKVWLKTFLDSSLIFQEYGISRLLLIRLIPAHLTNAKQYMLASLKLTQVNSINNRVYNPPKSNP